MLWCCPAFCSRQISIYTNTQPVTSTAKLLFITMRNERALKIVHGKRMDEVFLCITPSHKVHLWPMGLSCCANPSSLYCTFIFTCSAPILPQCQCVIVQCLATKKRSTTTTTTIRGERKCHKLTLLFVGILSFTSELLLLRSCTVF